MLLCAAECADAIAVEQQKEKVEMRERFGADRIHLDFFKIVGDCFRKYAAAVSKDPSKRSQALETLRAQPNNTVAHIQVLEYGDSSRSVGLVDTDSGTSSQLLKSIRVDTERRRTISARAFLLLDEQDAEKERLVRSVS
eukprot:SAG31_NODE_16039_length_726_cov_1.068581_1_plen_139_part_00